MKRKVMPSDASCPQMYMLKSLKTSTNMVSSAIYLPLLSEISCTTSHIEDVIKKGTCQNPRFPVCAQRMKCCFLKIKGVFSESPPWKEFPKSSSCSDLLFVCG